MTSDKPFDCVEYKRAIQARHAAESGALRPEEKLQRRTQWLSRSDNPAARLWREMNKRQPSAVSSR
jgi:hypothetical protein